MECAVSFGTWLAFAAASAGLRRLHAAGGVLLAAAGTWALTARRSVAAA
jgi:hypothetical protein